MLHEQKKQDDGGPIHQIVTYAVKMKRTQEKTETTKKQKTEVKSVSFKTSII